MIEKELAKLDDKELVTLFFGSQEEIKEVRLKHQIPTGVIDFICCLIDGEPLSTTIAKMGIAVHIVPPKNKQH